MIVKNEEKHIEKCLKALQSFSDDIVVVDTGSTDKTRALALKHTENVYDYQWKKDFADARNFSVSKAKNDFIMVVDADEFLVPLSKEQKKEIITGLKNNPDRVGKLLQRNKLTRNDTVTENHLWINRIFNRKHFHYEGKIHEQVVTLDGRRDFKTYRTDVQVLHVGYDMPLEERKKKAQRNIELLSKELETADKDYTPYILYQLGKSYYMSQNFEAACEYFSKGLEYTLNPQLEYVFDMVETYGYALLNSKQAGAALAFENIYDEFGYSADFQFLMGLIYMNNAMFDKAIEEFQKATKNKNCRTLGSNSFFANYNTGVIYECLGDTEKAKDFYLKCGKYEPAKKRLELLKSK